MSIVFGKADLNQGNGINQNSVSHKFSYRDGNDTNRKIGSHIAHCNGYDTANNWQKTENAHPGPSPLHETLCFFYFFPFDMQVFFNPFHFPETSDPIIEHATGYISGSSPYKQFYWIQTGNLQSSHNGF